MFRILRAITLASALMLAACGTTKVKSTTNNFVAKSNATTLLVKPDVELKILMANGMAETRADWSKDGENFLTDAIESALMAKSVAVAPININTNLTPQQSQIVKLNDAVVQAALTHDFGSVKLPTKKDKFDRTLGSGASVLSGTSNSDYALMIRARGSYVSTGKAVMNIATAALGFGMQTGSQTVFATLVDLDTGDIVWSNLAVAAAGEDMRNPDGAEDLAERVLKKFPL